MRCLVLGGAGFIGLHLARRLLSEGASVLVVDNFARGRRDAELAGLQRRGLRVLDLDLTDPGAWGLIPKGWDEVYHLVAVVGVRNVEAGPLRCLRVNTLPTFYLIDWLEGGERLFVASTSEVYAGGVGTGLVDVPTDEAAPVVVTQVAAPRSAYAISKLVTEAAVLHAAVERDLQAVVGRFHNVYGPRMGHDHVIPEILVRAATGTGPLVLPGADQARAFCYVDDAITAMTAVVREPACAGRVVHIGDDTEMTQIHDLALMVLDTVGARTTVQRAPAPPGSVQVRSPDLTLLRHLVGYEPTTPLREGLRQTWAWYSRQLERERSLTPSGAPVSAGRRTSVGSSRSAR